MSEIKREKSEIAPVEEDADFEVEERKMISELQREARDTKDPKEKVSLYVEAAKCYLELWGVDNLTNIEGVHLRNAVENLLPKFEEQLISPKKFGFGDYPGGLSFDMCEESAVQWLFHLYGINRKDVPEVFIVEDKTTGEKYKYERAMGKESRLEAFEKFGELRRGGHDVDEYGEVSEDFKEYVRRIREREHHEV